MLPRPVIKLLTASICIHPRNAFKTKAKSSIPNLTYTHFCMISGKGNGLRLLCLERAQSFVFIGRVVPSQILTSFAITYTNVAKSFQLFSTQSNSLLHMSWKIATKVRICNFFHHTPWSALCNLNATAQIQSWLHETTMNILQKKG